MSSPVSSGPDPRRHLDTLWQDARHALRLLRKAPGFTAAAVLTLAVGVGVSTAIFSVVNAVLLRPLPFDAPDRLVFITREGDVSIPDGVDWRASSRTHESLALFLRGWAFDLTGDGEPERLNGSVVEPDYFRVLGTPPLLGRALMPADNVPGAPQVAVLSQGFWTRRFAADPSVVGRGIVLSDVPTTIVGVMPAAFDFLGDDLDLWVPVAPAVPGFLEERGTNNFDAIGRLRPDVTVEAARAEMVAISQRLEEEYPKTNRRKIVEPMAMQDFLVGSVRRSLWVLLGAVALVMLVGSVNLAGLLLARSSARAGEFALRTAVGAPRRRLLQQLLVEGLVLALLGGGAGLLAAVWGRDLLVAAAPESLVRLRDVPLDGRVLGFGLLASLLSGVLMSLAPALQVLRADPGVFLKGAGKATGAAGRHRLLGALVVSELACACVLLVGGGLLGRTFARLQGQSLGFDSQGLLTAEVVLPESRYGARPAQTSAFAQMVERAAALPGVTSAAYVITPPLSPRGGIGSPLKFATPPDQMRTESPGARVRLVHGDYFGTLRLPIREGRALAASDTEGTLPVAVVNERLAREFWPGRSPVGERLSFGWTDEPHWMTIVGVASDLKGTQVTAPDSLTVYAPYVQRITDWQRWGTLVVRTRVEPHTLTRPLKQAVWSVDPTLTPDQVETVEERRAGQTAQQRFNALALVSFAAVALLVALQGVYALLAYAVEERRREIGVRMALGASGGDVLRLVLGRGLRLSALGLAGGLVLAFSLGRTLESLLFGVAPTDAFTFLAASGLLGVTALVACTLPAWRASRVDPIAVLRSE